MSGLSIFFVAGLIFPPKIYRPSSFAQKISTQIFCKNACYRIIRIKYKNKVQNKFQF